jgi:hypothetical protein
MALTSTVGAISISTAGLLSIKPPFLVNRILAVRISPTGLVFASLFYYLFIWIVAGTMVYAIIKFILLFRNNNAGFKGNHFLRYSVVALLVIAGGSYMYFCYRYPVGCTQNARYATLFFIPMDILMAKAAEDSFHFFANKSLKLKAKA